jgi:hypothetical protein
MEFGLMADKQAMPDVRLLADSIEIALDELRALPLPEVVRRRTAHAALGSAVVDSMGRAARGLADAAVRQAVAGTVGTVAKVAGQRGAVASIKRLARR